VRPAQAPLRDGLEREITLHRPEVLGAEVAVGVDVEIDGVAHREVELGVVVGRAQVDAARLDARQPFPPAISARMARGMAQAAPTPRDAPLVLQAGFRPFFLLAGAYAALAMVPWLAVIGGGPAAALGGGPLAFHAHEMVFGVTLAAVAGFLLTAVPNWTSTERVRGTPLLGLVLAWVIGRVAVALAFLLPATLVAVLDLLFVPALFLAVIPPIVRTRNERNYLFALLLALLFVADLLFHLSRIGAVPGEGRLGAKMGVYVEVFVVALVGGRIVPSFTANALRRAGASVGVPPRPRLQALTLVLVALALAADLLAEGSAASAALALTAGPFLTARLVSFQGIRTIDQPIVLILHVGYGFVCLGLFALGASAVGGRIGPSTALHVFTAGAIGTMVLAVMSRASLGHTGRPLVASRGLVVAYALVVTGALVRTAAPLFAPTAQPSPLLVSGALWAGGYLLFTLLFLPVLLGPRVDGAPG